VSTLKKCDLKQYQNIGAINFGCFNQGQLEASAKTSREDKNNSNNLASLFYATASHKTNTFQEKQDALLQLSSPELFAKHHGANQDDFKNMSYVKVVAGDPISYAGNDVWRQSRSTDETVAAATSLVKNMIPEDKRKGLEFQYVNENGGYVRVKDTQNNITYGLGPKEQPYSALFQTIGLEIGVNKNNIVEVSLEKTKKVSFNLEANQEHKFNTKESPLKISDKTPQMPDLPSIPTTNTTKAQNTKGKPKSNAKKFKSAVKSIGKGFWQSLLASRGLTPKEDGKTHAEQAKNSKNNTNYKGRGS
jgi:hypothetical protein